MLINVNTIIICVCETLNQVQCYITMMLSCYSSPRSANSVLSVGFGT